MLFDSCSIIFEALLYVPIIFLHISLEIFLLIIEQELRGKKEDITGNPETFLFKKDEEKHLFNKINEIRKYFSSTKKRESYEETLKILAEAKPATDNFFDNVIVNDENLDIKKNRLELLQMFCKTYNNFIDFSKVEGA